MRKSDCRKRCAISRIDELPWSDQARALRTRVNCLREWMPELDLPDFSDDALHASLDEWLMPHLAQATRMDALTPQLIGDALAARLDYAQRREVDELAPESITVPSGNTRRLDYHAGQPPVLAVKLQELFGLADTPRIARGKVPVTLHLAVACAKADSGHAGFARLLGAHLSGSEKRIEGTLSEASVARRSVDGDADASRQTARPMRQLPRHRQRISTSKR